MKKIRFIAAVAAFCLLLTSSGLAAVLGSLSDGYITTAPGGIRLAKGVYWTGNNYRTENYIEYSPSNEVFPVVAYGSKVTNYGNFSSMAALEESRGRRVIAGINGDYFNTWDYQPLGIVITEGILRSSDGGNWAVGFHADGTALMGKPSMKMTVTIGPDVYTLACVNKAMNSAEYSFFTSDYAPDTKYRSAARYAVLNLLSDEEFTVSCELDFEVEEIIETDKAFDIPDEKYVLALADTADEWRKEGMDGLETGSVVTVKIESAPGWSEVSYAVGSLYKLLTRGREEPYPDNDQAPRTAVGLKADGTVLFYTIDGRQSGYSVGASMSVLAKRLSELGCVEACIMDGGGSTGINAMYIGDKTYSQINRPSDGRPRAVTNYIMLVSTAPQTGRASQLALYPLSSHVLPGARIKFDVKAADAGGYAASVPSAVSFGVEGAIGSIDADGVYTASGTGRGKITADGPGQSGARVDVNVVETPDLITIRDGATNRILSKIEIMPGETAELKANAAANYTELVSDNSCYEWSVTGDIGSIDEEGRFTAAAVFAEGSIEVTAGKKTVTIPVKVAYPAGIFEDVTETDEFFEAVKYVTEAGLFNGMSQSEFMPYSDMTRAMFATVLWRAEGQPEIEYKDVFSDVPEGKWYTPAVIWADSEGIVRGYGDGLFGVSDPITTEQAAVILYRYAQSKNADAFPDDSDPEYFDDFPEASEYALPALNWAYSTGIMRKGDESAPGPREATHRHIVASAFMNYSAYSIDVLKEMA
ncbi:MAG: phosphodiester glycosidase family protein [Oscillospiraceae bacterium]|nr:phosphodiester glycosidase family protein [Oscillospiraceae bacterium]